MQAGSGYPLSGFAPWTCKDLGTVIFQGYAPPSVKAHLKATCKVHHGASSTGTLPFTGLDIGLIAVAALVLVALGLGLKSASRRKQ